MPVHQANDEYIIAIRDGARALPLLIPSTDAPLPMAGAVLAAVDGLLFTGSPSNVAPSHYGATARPGTELDEMRDATTLPLLRAAIAAGKPVLAICRGFQELNVALGGSLHQHVHEIPGRLDHREPKDVPLESNMAPPMPSPSPRAACWRGCRACSTRPVNSLHHQGIDRLAPGLKVEATGAGRPDRGGVAAGRHGISAGRAMASGMALCRRTRSAARFSQASGRRSDAHSFTAS